MFFKNNTIIKQRAASKFAPLNEKYLLYKFSNFKIDNYFNDCNECNIDK